MTTSTITEAVEQLAIEAIVPDPANRKASPDAQFVASIRTHGVIQPLLVTPHPDDSGLYRLVAGERRLRAAQKIGLDTVPAIVRTLSEQEYLECQLLENLQRTDLSVTQSAVAMTRLIDLGMSQKVLAKRIGRSLGYVRDRLRLMELPPEVRRLVDDDVVTIAEGLELVRLVDHPETLASVVEQVGPGYGNVEWLVSSALRQQEVDAKVAEGRAKAEAKGLRVLEHEGYHATSYVEVGGYGGLDVDGKAHAKEPCHAVVIGPRDGKPTPVCTDKKRHTRKGASVVKNAAKAAPDEAARAEKAARREATEHRREFIAGLLVSRVSKGDVLALVLPNYLDDANSHEQAAMAKLLGLEPVAEGSYDRWGEPLRAYASASDANGLRACLAFSLIQGEDAIAAGWAGDRGERHRAFLATKGYEPTAYEVAEAEAARVRNEELRSLQAQTEEPDTAGEETGGDAFLDGEEDSAGDEAQEQAG